MEFGWSPEQEDLYQRALAFSREKLNRPPGGTSGFSRELWRECGQFGLLGLVVPEKWGGLGLNAVSAARMIEALGRAGDDMGFIFSMMAHQFACVMPILEHGTDEQREALLPSLCSGERVAGNAITEAEAGSDLFAMKARAPRTDTGYALSGTKSYVTNGPVADLFLVYAVTRPEHGYLGISAFCVPANRSGITVGQPFEKVGLTSSPISSVYFDGCAIEQAERLGPEGQGARIFSSSMRWERTCLFAAWVGCMERVLERCIEFARSRRQFGKPISKNQSVSHKLVDMKLRLDSSRLLLYRACWEMDQGRAADLEISLAKLAVSEAALQAGIDAMRLHGGMGYLKETGIDRWLTDALPTTLFSGTSELQREMIASRLGL